MKRKTKGGHKPSVLPTICWSEKGPNLDRKPGENMTQKETKSCSLYNYSNYTS